MYTKIQVILRGMNYLHHAIDLSVLVQLKHIMIFHISFYTITLKLQPLINLDDFKGYFLPAPGGDL